MFDKIIGFIGAGNMGSAMIGGILNASLVTTGQVIASAHSKETLDAIHSRFSIETTLSNETVAERSDILFLAVKPNKFDEVIPQIAPHVKSSCIIVSIAAGKTIAAIEKAFGKEIKLVRAMPNTPALVGEAMSALCVNAHITEAELSEVQAIFNSFGKAEVVPESLIDAVVGVSGSSPLKAEMGKGYDRLQGWTLLSWIDAVKDASAVFWNILCGTGMGPLLPMAGEGREFYSFVRLPALVLVAA